MNDGNCLKIRWFGNSALIVVLYTIDDVHRVRRSGMVDWIWLKKKRGEKSWGNENYDLKEEENVVPIQFSDQWGDWFG